MQINHFSTHKTLQNRKKMKNKVFIQIIPKWVSTYKKAVKLVENHNKVKSRTKEAQMGAIDVFE